MHRRKFAPFYQKPNFYILNPLHETYEQPIIKYNAETIDIIVFALAKAGWYGGNPTLIYNSPIDDVINAYCYEVMMRDFEMTSYIMSKRRT